MISYSSPVQLAPGLLAGELARAANDALAEATAASSGRLDGLAALPWQHPDAAAAELERAVRELGLKGALIMGRPAKSFLDDASYLPVFAKLDELDVPLYVHPFVPLPAVQKAYYRGFGKEVSAQLSLAGWAGTTRRACRRCE